LTQMINLAGTGRPEFQPMRLIKLARDLYRTLDLPTDVDEILPEQPQTEPGFQPSALPQQATKGNAMVQNAGIPQAQPQVANAA
jgi:hypothetical protein